MFKLGENFRKMYNLTDEMCLKIDSLSLEDISSGSMSTKDKEISKYGMNNQGENLMEKKLKQKK
jgi:hypothetical protein